MTLQQALEQSEPIWGETTDKHCVHIDAETSRTIAQLAEQLDVSKTHLVDALLRAMIEKLHGKQPLPRYEYRHRIRKRKGRKRRAQ